jgi:hypothetical protein
VDLGLSDAEAWALTPRLLFRLLERRGELERLNTIRADRRAGEVTALIANVHRDTKKQRDPFSWLDFFPEHRPKPKAQTADEMAVAMRRWSSPARGAAG